MASPASPTSLTPPTPPTSQTTETSPSYEMSLEIPPAAGLEQAQALPYSAANFKHAVADRLRALDGGDTQRWIVFSAVDSSKLKYIDRIRLPVRLQLDDDKLIVRMVTTIHELMHCNLMAYIIAQMVQMGLRPGQDFISTGAGRCQHRSNNSFKEADSSLIPFPCPLPPWPAFVIEAGWTECLGRLHIDAHWWLSTQLPPNNTRMVVLASFKKSERTFCLERYELATVTGTTGTRSTPLGIRDIAMCTATATIDLRPTPPIITGAPFVLPFDKIMRRPAAAAEQDVSFSAANLVGWATGIAHFFNV